MVHITTSLVLSFMLVAPSIAIPVYKDQDFQVRTEDIEARSFGSFFKKIRKIASPSNLKKAASVASLVIRDDIPEAYERSLEDSDELAARDPSFGSFFRKIRKVVNPSNIRKVASVASLAIRDEYPELSERDLEYLDDLVARDPSFGSFFKKIKNFFSPKNVDKASNTAKEASKLVGMLKREDISDLSERGFDDEDVEELTARDFEIMDELVARDPSFGSFFRKVKKFANFKNIKKAASVASLVIREDDDVFERHYPDFELDELD